MLGEYISTTQVFCAEHAPEGVSDYRHTMCFALDCIRQGLWIDPRASACTNVEAYCHVHRHAEMILRSTRRRQIASSSVACSDSAASGAACKGNEIVLAQEMRLLGSGKGRSALGTAESCEDVAERGSRARGEEAPRKRSSKHLKCMHPLGCEVFASFGVPGDKARFCVSHKAAHHTNLRKSCLVTGCNARPMYGVDNVLTHCGAHRSVSCTRLYVRMALCMDVCVGVAESERGVLTGGSTRGKRDQQTYTCGGIGCEKQKERVG